MADVLPATTLTRDDHRQCHICSEDLAGKQAHIDEWGYAYCAAHSRICARRACTSGGACWWNPSTRAYYCPNCAKAINRYNPGLCIPPPPSSP